ncbi:MAG TPA: ABC transporter permease [Thermoleophilaceae bacterium]
MAQGGVHVIGDVLPIAGAFGDFRDAIEFIFTSRESVTGGIDVGGLGEIGHLTRKHLEVSLLAVLIACAVSLPIGLWLGHIGRGEFLAISISNVGRAVPTLALLAFFVAYIGVGTQNVVLVLVLLAIPPILTNTYVGVRQVDRETVDAARGVGLTETQIVRKIELPMALNTIFGGIRTSAVNVVATATIAPLASVDSLGTPIINGNVYGDAGRLGAAILVALLTLALDLALAGAQRAATPKGLRPTTDTGRGRRLPIPLLRREEQVT